MRNFRSLFVFTLVLAAAAPAATIAFFFARSVSRLTSENADRELRLGAERAAEAMRHELERLRIRVDALGRNADVAGAVRSVLFEHVAQRLLEEVRRESPLVGSIALLDGDDRGVLVLPDADATPTSQLRFRDDEKAGRFERAQDGGGFVFAAPVRGLLGHHAGRIVASIPAERIQSFLAARAGVGQSIELGADAATNSPSERVAAQAPLGIPELGADAPLVILSESRAARFRIVETTQERLLLGAAAGTLFLAVLAYALGRRLSRPLRRLAQVEGELRTLKQQMHPHFLFNILNNLGALVHVDPDQAVEMIAKLSQLYRRMLEASKAATVTLADELDVVRDFLELQKLRFGERIRYEINVPAEFTTLHVPALLMQTLAENAIKHGIEGAREGGRLSIQVRSEGGIYRCEVRNTGAPLESAAHRHGTGLENTRRRLELLYGEDGRFDLRTEADGSTTLATFTFSGKRG